LDMFEVGIGMGLKGLSFIPILQCPKIWMWPVEEMAQVWRMEYGLQWGKSPGEAVYPGTQNQVQKEGLTLAGFRTRGGPESYIYRGGPPKIVGPPPPWGGEPPGGERGTTAK